MHCYSNQFDWCFSNFSIHYRITYQDRFPGATRDSYERVLGGALEETSFNKFPGDAEAARL